MYVRGGGIGAETHVRVKELPRRSPVSCRRVTNRSDERGVKGKHWKRIGTGETAGHRDGTSAELNCIAAPQP